VPSAVKLGNTIESEKGAAPSCDSPYDGTCGTIGAVAEETARETGAEDTPTEDKLEQCHFTHQAHLLPFAEYLVE